MYKYFSELENPSNYKIYLEMRNFDKNRDKNVRDACLPADFLTDYKDLFKRIDMIDMLIDGSNEQILMLDSNVLTYEEWDAISSLVSKKDEDYYHTKKLKEKINITTTDLENLLRDYITYCNHLIIIYPNLKKLILETKNIMENALTKLKNKTNIKIESLTNGVVYKFPNSWYITPNGFLYNSGTGHQEGNLQYPYYNVICDHLRKKQQIPDINLLYKIKEILDREYVTALEFSTYSNSIYKIPTILTPEVEHDIERYNNILKMSNENFEKIVKNNGWPQPERTYQKNIITLVTGYFAAKTALFQSFQKINDSSKKTEIVNSISNISLDEILVRYSGFHKISSVVDKTITTSSILSIELFKEYLNKGWTLDVIPGIIYDKEKDELVETDFDWYHISKYLDNVLSKNTGPGKILIKRKNINI